MQCSSRVSAFRRELNSHEAAEPQIATSASSGSEARMAVACGREKTDAVRAWRSRTGRVMLGRPSIFMRIQNMEPWDQLAKPSRFRVIGYQPVFRAAMVSMGAFLRGLLARRLEYFARLGLQRGAGGTSGSPSRDSKISPLATRHASMPNPSLKRSANGRPPSPGRWYAVHFHRPGLGVLPLSPA